MFKRFRRLISVFSPFPILTWRPRRAFMPNHRSVYLHCQRVMSLPEVSLSLTPLGFWCSCLLRCPQVPAGTNLGLGRRQLSTRGSDMFLPLDAQFCLRAGRCYGSCGVPRDMAKQQSPQTVRGLWTDWIRKTDSVWSVSCLSSELLPCLPSYSPVIPA